MTQGAADPRPADPRPVLELRGPPESALEQATLRALDTPALVSFLAGRRWFGAKGVTPRRVQVHDVVAVHEGDRRYAVARLEVELPDGRVERYQLPLAVVREDAPVPPTAAVLADLRAADGARALLVDATADEGFLRLLARGLERGATYSGGALRLEMRPLEGADVTGLGGLPVRVVAAEQSNSSLLLGDRAILKLYRKLEAGENPDVEITRFLTTRTDFRNTPELLGTVAFEETGGVDTVAGMLQRLVPGARDAWSVALDAVREYMRARQDEPPNPLAPRMRELGRVTRELHDALASHRDDPAFAPRAVTAGDVATWGSRVRAMVHDATALLAAARERGRLRPADVPIADAVLRRRAEVLGDVEELVIALGDHPGSRIRHHGDYHLGQVLEGSDGRWMIIDFEGEPARLLAERRAPDSPLRDVAGMIRSFAYAAATGAMEAGGVGTNPAVEARAARWERAVREAFLAGYDGPGGAPYLPADPTAATYLLMLFEMEKVFYELGYELNNRPEWVWIPLRGIGRLLGSPALPRRDRGEPRA
ncbi:MAG TPA: putative maltokinase [Gemmatimonadales bacterium]